MDKILDLAPAAYLDSQQYPEQEMIVRAIYGAIQEECDRTQAVINSFIKNWINPNTAIEENIDNYLRLQLNFDSFWRKDWDIAAKRWLCRHYRWVWGASDRAEGIDRPNYTRAGVERLFQVFGLNARVRSAGEFILNQSLINQDSIGSSALVLNIDCSASYQIYSKEFQTIEMIRKTFISATLDVQIQRIL